jgi:hypothetical protein
MKTTLLCLMIGFSATAFAQTDTQDQNWEGAGLRVQSEYLSSASNGVDADNQLELSHPWHYGRQDSDALVSRERQDEHHD